MEQEPTAQETKTAWTHGIMLVKREEFVNADSGGNLPIYHVVLYEQLPTIKCYSHLYQELASDEEFGLTETIGEYILVPAPQSIVDETCELNFSDEDEADCS